MAADPEERDGEFSSSAAIQYEQDDILVVDENNINEDDDEGPAYIDAEEAVEVDVDLENEPMSDEDDEGLQQDEGDNILKEEDMAVINDMAACVLSAAHAGPVYSCAAIIIHMGDNSDSSSSTIIIASGGGDDKVFIHTVLATPPSNMIAMSSVELIPPTHKSTDTVTSVAFNNTSVPAVLATGCYDGTIQLWDVNIGEGGAVSAVHNRQLDGPSDIEWISWHPNGGTVLLAGSTDGTVWMWFAPTGKCLQVFVGHSAGDGGGSTAGSFTPDGKFAVTAGVDGTLRLWAPKKGLCKHTFTFGGNISRNVAGSAITSISLIQNNNSDDSLAAVGCEDGTAWIAHLTHKKVLGCLHHHITSNSQQPIQYNDDDDTVDVEPRSVEAVGFAPQALNVKWFATAGIDGVLKIWDTSNNSCRQTCVHTSSDGLAAGVTRLVWHTALPFIYTSASDGVIRLWDARSGSCLTSLTGHSDVINDMSIMMGDGTMHQPDVIITGSDDYTVRTFVVYAAEYNTTSTTSSSQFFA